MHFFEICCVIVCCDVDVSKMLFRGKRMDGGENIASQIDVSLFVYFLAQM